MAKMTCDGHPSRFGRVLVLPNGSPFIVTGYQPSDSIILITSRTFRDFLLFSRNVGLSYVSTTAGMWHYRSKNLFTSIICVICVNLWKIKLLATD